MSTNLDPQDPRLRPIWNKAATIGAVVSTWAHENAPEGANADLWASQAGAWMAGMLAAAVLIDLSPEERAAKLPGLMEKVHKSVDDACARALEVNDAG